MHREQVKVGQLDISYFAVGEGTPLIIIHGGVDGARSWLRMARQLGQYYRVYAPDLPGFGSSQSMGDFQIRRYVEFIDGFARSLRLRRFCLIGHSIGGAIALHYA
ncbi:MAG: alpha/beta hydrolase, partial [Chloroflexota bacterium]